MKKIILVLSVILSAFAIESYGADKAKNSVASAPDPVIENIIRSYVPWTSAEFNGKLRCDKLPVSPTIKIYMVRDSLLQLSARAPLVGEVGRLTLTRDRLQVVNKLQRTYCSEPASQLFELYPNVLADLQSLLLARVVVLGQGELAGENSEAVEIEQDNGGGWMVIPVVSDQVIPFDYGYLVGSNSRTKAFLGTIPKQGSVQIIYSYANKGMTMEVGVDAKGKKTDLELEFNSVRWGGSEMSPIKLDNYRLVGIKEFISSFKK